MKKKELIDLFYDVEEAAERRQKAGDFDANSEHIRLLLIGLSKVIQLEIERMPDDPKEGKTKR